MATYDNVKVFNLMDMFSVFSLVDFQHDYTAIVNSRLVAPKLGAHITTYYGSPQSVAKHGRL